MDPSVSTGENPDSNENNPQESEFESNNSCGDALGKALSTMLATVIKDLDSKAQDTFNSQDKLNSAIDRLTRELDQLLEDAPLPFIMQHAAKISGVRKRVSSLNSVLKSIQKRVDNIDRLLFNGDAGMIKMFPTKPLVVGTFSEYPPLGRLAMRDMRQTVAVGVMKSVEKKDASSAKVTKSAAKKGGK
ncbi:hypothetical protein H0E87_016460 [Populus deltoides]|uniref:Biogenesis of lysosome-related organelles complex 1 subunit 7 n=1 Tax=Populus deltoides TaxID=3696 RepID=A0A8T2Y9E6_POPDE|nr:hypothetical protein H0E87_016460 [Populus deltoides]